MKVPKPALLCASESWAFGPVATLMAILSHIGQEVDCTFAGTGTALGLAAESPNVFRQVTPLKNPVHMVNLAFHADHVLSVMDPWAALWAVRHGVPCTYVDILSWFWSWNRLDWPLLQGQAAQLLAASTEELEAALLDINPVFLGYLWSDEVFVQRFSDRALQGGPSLRVNSVGAIIRCTPRGQHVKRASPLISLSGGLSPLIAVTTGERYCRIVSEILAPNRDVLGTTRIIVNPLLIPCMKGLGWDAQSLSYSEYRAALASCSFLLCPPGLSSVLEAAASGVPVISLPEQHDIQMPIYNIYSAGASEYFPELFLSRACASTFSGVQHEVIDALDGLYQNILAGGRDEAIDALRARLRKWAVRFQSPPARETVGAKQATRIRACVGDFVGAETIATHLRLKISGEKPMASSL